MEPTARAHRASPADTPPVGPSSVSVTFTAMGADEQIGERLHPSARTVGPHLYRIFPKLDITARGRTSGCLRGG